MYLIVGLGNPGEKYLGTKHNLGFEFLDELVRKKDLGEWSKERKFKAEIIKTPDFILAKPQTFMNQSGISVSALANFFKIASEKIVVIHDELDLPIGHLKIRIGGAAAGHHGVESVIEKLGTDKFIRIRLGIGNLRTLSSERDGQQVGIDSFVLSPFKQKERSEVKKMIKHTLKAFEILMDKGIEKAQNQFN